MHLRGRMEVMTIGADACTSRRHDLPCTHVTDVVIDAKTRKGADELRRHEVTL